MNTRDQNLEVALHYYRHLLDKNFEAMENCVHPAVSFLSPLVEMSGRAAVISSAKNLSQTLQDIEIRAKFEMGNRIMLAYDFIFPEPIGKLRSAVLMELTEKLISKIELFFDGRPFLEK